jgi:hypothetical protein
MGLSDEAIKEMNSSGKDLVQYFPGVGADNEKPTAHDLLARTIGHTAGQPNVKIFKHSLTPILFSRFN